MNRFKGEGGHPIENQESKTTTILVNTNVSYIFHEINQLMNYERTDVSKPSKPPPTKKLLAPVLLVPTESKFTMCLPVVNTMTMFE